MPYAFSYIPGTLPRLLIENQKRKSAAVGPETFQRRMRRVIR
jgi:hypothetical protein